MCKLTLPIFLVYFSGRKEDSDLRDDTIPLLGGCVAVIFVYCCVATFNLKVKGNRVILTLAGLISSAVSIAGAFGVMLAAEVPLVSISIIIPFIVAGTTAEVIKEIRI